MDTVRGFTKIVLPSLILILGYLIANFVISYLMAAVMAVTIVLSIRIMGIVLLLSLVTMPVVIANMLVRSYQKIALTAPIIAVIGNLTGLIISYEWEVPPGAAIIFTLSVGLIAVKLLTLCRK